MRVSASTKKTYAERIALTRKLGLGHVHVNDTYWYLEAVPELLQLATDRLIHRKVQP